MKSFSIIGAGNLGTNLIHSLVEKQFQLKYIYNKSKYGYFVDFVTGNIHSAVKDKKEGKVFFHTSNSLTSDELLPLKEKGAYIASFSPLQTFAGFNLKNSREADIFKDVYFLAEGDEPALVLAREIAGSLGARLLIVDKSNKIYFHIAAVCASNFLISILKLSENQLKKSGGCIVEGSDESVDIKVLLPLIQQTLENVKTRGIDASLTGPVKRKETDIIQSHLAHLEREDLVLYKALTDYLLYSFS